LLWAFILLGLLTSGGLLLYVFQFQDTNAYIGIGPMRELADPGYWVLLAGWLLAAVLIFPAHVRRPSDVFLGMYIVATGLWSASYWPATRLLDDLGAAVLAGWLLLPAALVCMARRAIAAVPLRAVAWPAALSARWLVPALMALLALAAWLGYRTGGADAGFDFEDATLRRLAGRDRFAGSPLAAYLVQMSVNGIAPYLAYLAAVRRLRAAGAAALAFAVFSFWLLGLKSPVLNVAVLYALGWLVREGRIVHFNRWLTSAFLGLIAMALVELWLFDQSLIAEFAIRRVMLVSSIIQVYFADALSRLDWGAWLFGGLHYAGFASPEYFIGANYMGNEQTNANTNAFLHQAAMAGFAGYLTVAGLAAVLLAVLDMAYLRAGRQDGFAFAAMLGMLLVEQAFGTALVSSGLLLCLILMMLFSAPEPQTARRASARLACGGILR
jgi:hypothetical protein